MRFNSCEDADSNKLLAALAVADEQRRRRTLARFSWTQGATHQEACTRSQTATRATGGVRSHLHSLRHTHTFANPCTHKQTSLKNDHQALPALSLRRHRVHLKCPHWRAVSGSTPAQTCEAHPKLSLSGGRARQLCNKTGRGFHTTSVNENGMRGRHTFLQIYY